MRCAVAPWPWVETLMTRCATGSRCMTVLAPGGEAKAAIAMKAASSSLRMRRLLPSRGRATAHHAITDDRNHAVVVFVGIHRDTGIRIVAQRPQRQRHDAGRRGR